MFAPSRACHAALWASRGRTTTATSTSTIPSAGRTPPSGVLPGAAGLELIAAGGAAAGAVAGPAGAEVRACSSTTAIGVPTTTVAPSATRISRSTPPNGDGISTFTLSVMTSTRGSYFATGSPGRLSHLPIVPSCTLSPSWGILISVGIRGPLLVGGQGAGGVGDLRGGDHEPLLERVGKRHRRHLGAREPGRRRGEVAEPF